MTQVYFVEDPVDRGWKIVRHVEPRSRRVTGEDDGGLLSAPGRSDAVHNVNGRREDSPERAQPPQRVLAADVDQVVAHFETDVDDVAHADLDYADDDVADEEPDAAETHDASEEPPVVLAGLDEF